MTLHRTLATPICGRCDRDIEFLKPCYFWPITNPFERRDREWALLCRACFSDEVAEDMQRGDAQED